MTELAEKKCVPCEGGVPPLDSTQIQELLAKVDGWRVEQGYHLTKDYLFDDFAGALAFTNAIGEIAEAQGHHPDIHLSWGKVRVEIWTHKINGLTESDFILAAKFDSAK